MFYLCLLIVWDGGEKLRKININQPPEINEQQGTLTKINLGPRLMNTVAETNNSL